MPVPVPGKGREQARAHAVEFSTDDEIEEEMAAAMEFQDDMEPDQVAEGMPIPVLDRGQIRAHALQPLQPLQPWSTFETGEGWSVGVGRGAAVQPGQIAAAMPLPMPMPMPMPMPVLGRGQVRGHTVDPLQQWSSFETADGWSVGVGRGAAVQPGQVAAAMPVPVSMPVLGNGQVRAHTVELMQQRSAAETAEPRNVGGGRRAAVQPGQGAAAMPMPVQGRGQAMTHTGELLFHRSPETAEQRNVGMGRRAAVQPGQVAAATPMPMPVLGGGQTMAHISKMMQQRYASESAEGWTVGGGRGAAMQPGQVAAAMPVPVPVLGRGQAMAHIVELLHQRSAAETADQRNGGTGRGLPMRSAQGAAAMPAAAAAPAAPAPVLGLGQTRAHRVEQLQQKSATETSELIDDTVAAMPSVSIDRV